MKSGYYATDSPQASRLQGEAPHTLDGRRRKLRAAVNTDASGHSPT
eukprot:gene1258-24578_t